MKALAPPDSARRVAGTLLGAGVLALALVADSYIPGANSNPLPPTSTEDWRFLPAEHLVAGSRPMNATTVIAGGPGFVAGGTALPTGGAAALRTAAIWVTSNGLQWSHVDSPDFNPIDGTHTEITTLVRQGQQLIAVGKEEGIPGDHGEELAQLATWTSPDGIEWSRVPPSAIPYPTNPQSMAMGGPISATADESGISILVYFDGAPYIWRSQSGRDWALHPLNTTTLCDTCVIEQIRATNLGTLALGRDGDTRENPMQNGVVFRVDADGNVHDLSSSFKTTWPIDAASIHRSTVIIGYQQRPSGNPTRESAATIDGETWTKSTNFELPETVADAEIQHLLASENTFLALGALSTGSTVQPAVWSSPDGIDWVVAPLLNYATTGHLVAVAVHKTRYVIIASSGYGPGQTQNGIFVNF